MPLKPLLAPSDFASVGPQALPVSQNVGNSHILAAISAAREELTAAGVPNQAASSSGAPQALHGVAEAILTQRGASRRDPWIGEVLSLIKTAHAAGVYDLPADPKAVAAAEGAIAQGWVGVLAAMLQVGAWELSGLPKLDAIPDWLWSDYSRWVFTGRPRFALSQSEAWTISQVERAREVAAWLARNVGSSVSRAAADALLGAGHGCGESTSCSAADREFAQARAKILTKLFGTDRETYSPSVRPRHGRRLRVGFVSTNFGPNPDLLRVVPSFEQINAEAFEVFLFPITGSDTPESTYCASRAATLQVLPAGTSARVAYLREAQLDAVIFVGELLGAPNELTEIAAHRVAPLQAVNAWSGATTGLPEIDLAICPFSETTSEPAAHFTERLGAVRGPAVTISAALADASASQVTRADLELPSGLPLLVATVDSGGADFKQLQAWAEILARAPDAHLAVAYLHSGETPLLGRFCAAVDRVVDAQHIARNRVRIFPAAVGQPQEARALIGLADLFLDAQSGTAASWTATEALRRGIPIVALAGDLSASAAVLRSMGLSQLVAVDFPAYIQIATGLLTDGESLNELKTQLAALVEAIPPFLDSLAASDAFGALIETAFDEVASLGHAEFRQQSEVVRCFGLDDLTEAVEVGLVAHAQGDLDTAAAQAAVALRSAPGDVRARQLYGVVLHAQGNLPRAIAYLMAAVQQSEATAATWYFLALALRDNGQASEAIQALETCIRLDHRHVDALLTILELAERVGATEIARDVLESLQLVAPEDPRVLAMS